MVIRIYGMNDCVICLTMQRCVMMQTNGLTTKKLTRLSKQFLNSRYWIPAVGSGAFPMGVLHKLTLALRRLDPDNTRWEALQKELAAAAFNTQNQQERDDELTEISDTFERYRDSDFGRKLYLIQNSIFGVDIQPIACQIAKLRFFISLAIEQEADRNAENFGIKPLPNLETPVCCCEHTDRTKTTDVVEKSKGESFGAGTP